MNNQEKLTSQTEQNEQNQHPSYVKIEPLYNEKELLNIFSKYSDIEEETRREEGSKRSEQLLAENQEYQNLLKEYKKKRKMEKEFAFEQIRIAVQKAWDGEFGPGEWALVFEKGVQKFRNVIPLDKWQRKEIDKNKEEGYMFKFRSSEHNEILLNPANVENELDKGQYHGSDSFRNDLLEVDISKILNENELRDEYQKLFDQYAVEHRFMSLNDILNALPENFKPNARPGTLFYYGGCSHHSGEIRGYLILLPTGNLAVISEYDGESEWFMGEHQFWGILKNPKTEPSWSAKHIEWDGDKLDKPTKEEVDFLKNFRKKGTEDVIIENLPELPLPDDNKQDNTDKINLL